jgi:hypothetical protein
MPEELMTGSNNKTRDITSNRKYLIKNARQAAYKARMREAGYKQIAVWVREDVREQDDKPDWNLTRCCQGLRSMIH